MSTHVVQPVPAAIRTASPKRRRKWSMAARVAIFTTLFLLLLVATGVWLVTRSWFIISQLTPEMESKLGGEVTIGNAAYQGDGRVTFTNMRLRARALPGQAGEIARINRAIVRVDLSRLLRGDLHVADIEIDDATFRLSEDQNDSGKLNILALNPDWSGDGDGPPSAPPRVRIRRAALEFGAHNDGKYEALGRRLVSGDMYASSAQDGWFNFELVEVDESGKGVGPGGIFIKGNWNPLSNEHFCRVDGIELDDRVYRMCPQVARLWWKEMDLEGKVDSVIINWHPARPFSVEFAVRNVGLTLPIETEELWARYRDGTIEPTASRPRMRVNRGTIRVTSEAIALENMTGNLTSIDPDAGAEQRADVAVVPFNFSFVMSSLPPIDWDLREQWMKEVLDTAPFELKFRMDEFSVTRNEAGESPALDLPAVVAKALAKFQMTDWVMSTSLELVRGAPIKNESGKLIAAQTLPSGQAYIHKASGRYHKFPYQLEGVEAYLQFDNERVLVHYLNGRGSGDSQFRITGVIAPPEKDASVTLRVAGSNVPLDDRLRAAFGDNEREAFDSLFDRSAYESLARANLVPNEDSIRAAQRRRSNIVDEIAQLRHAEAHSPQTAARIATLQRDDLRLQRYIDAGPFKFGGAVNVDLRIERELGLHKPTKTTGTMEIVSAGAVYENFPYPLRVTGGLLEWHDDRVSIRPGPTGEGVQFVTPGGGRGSITGELLFPKEDGQRKVQPNFVVTIGDDEFNPNVYAAIPMPKSEREQLDGQRAWPGGALASAASLVQGIGLVGACDYAGVIQTNEQGRIGFEFQVSLQNGSAMPSNVFATALGFRDQPWPRNIALANVNGHLTVNRDEVRWSNVTGNAGESVVATTGVIDYRGDNASTDIDVRFERLPVEPYVLNAASAEHAQNLARLWTRFQPQGVFDAHFKYTAGLANQPDIKTFSILPRDVSVMLYGKRINLSHQRGDLQLDGESLAINELAMAMTQADRDDGLLALNGSYNPTMGETNLTGSWKSGRFESPLITEILHASDTQTAKRYRDLRAVGTFDSHFAIISHDGGPINYHVDVDPQRIQARWNNANLAADITGGRLTFVPQQLTIADLAGRTSGGAFELSGTVHMRDLVEADLQIGYDGLLRDRNVWAFLPTVARDAFDGIVFADNKTNSRAKFNLKLAEDPQYSDEWRTALKGTVSPRGASLEAGVLFEHIHGDFALDLTYQPGTPPQLAIDADLHRTTALGQKLTNLRAPITLEDGARIVRLPWLVAQAELGTITAEASVGIGEELNYNTIVEFVGVPLDGFSVQPAVDVASPSASAANAADLPRGDVYASFSLAGLRGKPESKRGRGLIRVLNGNMANVPLALQLIQVFQLTLPLSGVLDYAEADMYLVGDRVHFEKILFESTSGDLAMLQLFGEGEMNFATFDLNTRFRSRSGVHGVREVFGAISDTLYEIEVTGPLRSPQTRVVPLPGRK